MIAGAASAVAAVVRVCVLLFGGGEAELFFLQFFLPFFLINLDQS
jgi:hypothetical protein